MDIVQISLSQLRAHPLNSNVMREDLLDKLVAHIQRTGQYPPIIVRKLAEENTYQVLDGHHRWLALQRVGCEQASCVVWDVGDAGALVLLSTLNRLQGQDDPRKRSRLFAALREKLGQEAGAMAKLLPESVQQVRKYLALREAPPAPAMPRPLDEMPTGVTFFLTGVQKRALDEKLGQVGGAREAALLQLLEIA